jgi:hypothetical protein
MEGNLPGSDRAIKIAGAICYALLAAILIVLNNSPATDYEASIYTATPSIVWVVIIITFVCGLGIIVHQLYTGRHEAHNLWLLGIGLTAASSLIACSVQILRGYIHLGGDVTTHLAYVQNIISGGHFESQIVYPAMHVYLAQLSQILNVDPMRLILYIPVLFYIVYMLFIYLLARAILPEKGHVLLATVAGMVLPLYFIIHHATPLNMADMMVPFAFLLCQKYLYRYTPQKAQFAVLLLIIAFLLPVFHPIAATALLLTLLTISLPGKAYDRLIMKKRPAGSEYRFATLLSLILFIWLITWVSGLHVWEQMVRSMRDVITLGITKTSISGLKTSMAYASGYGYSVIEQFLKVYAMPLIYGLLTIISLPLLFNKLPRNNQLRSLLAWCGPLGIFVVLMGISFGPVVGLFFNRVSRYIIIVSALFVGFVFYEVLKSTHRASGKNPWPKLSLGLTAVALIIVYINMVFTTNGSHFILSPNSQMTRSEITGVGWFINNKKVDVTSLFLSTQGYRIKYLFLPRAEAIRREDIPGWVPFPQPPYHFNYDKNTRLGESYQEDYYLVLNQQDRLLYTEVWPEMAEYRFYPQDFEKLEQDPSVDKLYASSGLDIWYIHSLPQAP